MFSQNYHDNIPQPIPDLYLKISNQQLNQPDVGLFHLVYDIPKDAGDPMDET